MTGSESTISAIVLAAGKSRRMGTQKLLLPVAGWPLIVHVVNEVRRSGVSPVFVVTGTESQPVCAVLASLPVTIVPNQSPDGDMLSSIRCGLRALPDACSGILIVLGDQPGITAELIAQLIVTQQRTGKPLAVPACQGHRGHPVLLNVSLRDELLTHHDGTGLRGLLRDHVMDIVEVAVDDPSLLQDVDFPEDYAKLIKVPGIS